MSGETDLSKLIATMRPELRDGTYVFVTMPLDGADPVGLEAVMSFREAEGVTMIVPEHAASAAGLVGGLPLPHGYADGSFSPGRRRLPGGDHDALGCGWDFRERGVRLLSRPSLRPGGTGGRDG